MCPVMIAEGSHQRCEKKYLLGGFNNYGNQVSMEQCVEMCQNDNQCMAVAYTVGGRSKNLGNCHGFSQCPKKQPGPDEFYTFKWEECKVNPKQDLCLVQLAAGSKKRCDANKFVTPAPGVEPNVWKGK